MSERFGIKNHYIGEKVKDDVYGEGRILNINALPKEKWHSEEFQAGKITIKFNSGEILECSSSCVESIN